MSHNHVTNPSLNTGKRNNSNFRKPATPYKAIMLPPNKGSNATQKVHAIMAELDNKEELKEAKTAFIEYLDNDPESAKEPEDFQ